MKMLLPSLLLASFAAHAAPPSTQVPAPAVTEADHELRDAQFASGEALPTVRLHVRTLGTLRRDQSGRAANAVLILHGTTGSGAGFLAPTYAGVLFGPGQLLDASRCFIILPDNVGHGGELLEMEWGLPARGWAPQPHVHPRLTEEYEELVSGDARQETRR